MFRSKILESRERDRGQAAIESALVLPLMVFFALAVVQLTMIEQAKLMTEYAAFQAARAGIVWNGNNARMHDAALFALLPTMGKTDGAGVLAQTWLSARAQDSAMAKLPWGSPVPESINGSLLRGQVRVDTVSPADVAPLGSIWNLPEGANWKELDFDGPDTYAESPRLEQHLAHFFDVATPDAQEELYRRATVLQIRLRYLYELRVPFANWMIFIAWVASNADRGIANGRGYATVYPSEMAELWRLAGEHRVFLPLHATYSMRMQSNFHRKWVMHLNPEWGL